jgi:putative DNA-invertase from lambdoid prophage Rac
VNYFFGDMLSGKTSTSQRPQFTELMKKIREGETLVASKLNHTGRDAQDIGDAINTLKKLRIKIIVLQLGNLDIASPAR